MCRTSIFLFIMTMIRSFTIIFIFTMFIFKFVFTNITYFCIGYDGSCCLSVNNFFIFLNKLFPLRIPLTLQDIFLHSLPIHHLCIIPIFYACKCDILRIRKPGRICLPAFVVNVFSRLFLHRSIFSTEHSRSP